MFMPALKVTLLWLSLPAQPGNDQPRWLLPRAVQTPQQLQTNASQRMLKSFRELLQITEEDRKELERRTGEDNRKTIEILRRNEEDLKRQIARLEQQLAAPPLPSMPLAQPGVPRPKLPVRD